MFFRSCLVLFFFFGVSWCGAQKKFMYGNSVPSDAVDAEKVYLQLTGKVFNTSEIIWFKAVVTNAFDNLPSTTSRVLHVELIEPINNQILDSKLLKLENGTADSFFQLHRNYPEGKYAIRAYTEWNKNFGTDFMYLSYVDIFHFEKPEDRVNPIRDIVITKKLNEEMVSVSTKILPHELDSLHSGNAMLYLNWKGGKDSVEIKQKKDNPVYVVRDIDSDVKTIGYFLTTQNKSYSKSIVLDENSGSLSFFPEGGEQVNGVKSSLGFKYLNYKGKGAEIEGKIVDQADNELAIFKSNHLGMGRIELMPEMGRHYFGIVRAKNGNTYKYPLPVAREQGLVMQIMDRKSFKLIVLDMMPKRTDSIFVKLYHRGKDIYMLRALMKNGKFKYAFKNKLLPNGLIGATLYDSKHKPIAERHFYNHRPNENLSIKMEIDKNEYEVRDSVVVHIRSENEKQPIPSSVSLMAVNQEYFEQTNLTKSNIVSYFMLESDIRGKIEDPAYYFEEKEHLRDLDYLMLTQGWTNYKYDKPQKPKINQPEKGLALSGYVGGVQNIKKKKRFKDEKFDLVLMTFGESGSIYQQEIDRTGYFNFSLRDSYGDGKKFVIQPASSERKNASFKVNISERKIPEIEYEIEEVIAPVDTVIEKTVTERIVRDITRDPYLLPNTIALTEVVVSDYFLTPEREEMKKLHGMPDVVIDSKELLAKEKNWTGRLYSWLLFNFPQELNIRRVGGLSGFQYASVFGAGFTYVLVDGIPVTWDHYSVIPDIPIRAVKSVELIRNTATANRYFCDVFPQSCIASPPWFPAILAIYTYSGKGLFGAFPKKTNVLQASAPEFSPKREFYSPEYDSADDDGSVPDLRTLIHWQPDIRTDAQGNATVKFFNGDITGEVLIICEGIGIHGGGIGRGEISYDVVE